LKVLEECLQIDPTEADAWRRRSTGYARYHAVGAEAETRTSAQIRELHGMGGVMNESELAASNPHREARPISGSERSCRSFHGFR